MARRKRFVRKMRSFAGRFARRAKKSGSSENLLLTAAAAGVYGAVRPKIESAIAPMTSKIPLGGYADEIVLGTLGYFMAKGKLGNNKFVRSAGKAMLVIEAARTGSGLSSQFITTSSGASNFNNEWN